MAKKILVDNFAVRNDGPMYTFNSEGTSTCAAIDPLFSSYLACMRGMRELIIRNEVHESDFHFFQNLEGDRGLFLDVGAHAGQSAHSLLLSNKSMRVLSLEPNPQMVQALELVRRRFPKRFIFMQLGGSHRRETKELWVPYCQGLDLSARSSVFPAEFEKDYVRRQINEEIKTKKGFGSFKLASVKIDLRPLDTLRLNPSVVKLDVEGAERSVLEGASTLLKRSHPLLLIENNNVESFWPYLSARGYCAYRFDNERKLLIAVDLGAKVQALNYFWFTKQTRGRFQEHFGSETVARWFEV
jgi:FkbM family methyltransferase